MGNGKNGIFGSFYFQELRSGGFCFNRRALCAGNTKGYLFIYFFQRFCFLKHFDFFFFSFGGFPFHPPKKNQSNAKTISIM